MLHLCPHALHVAVTFHHLGVEVVRPGPGHTGRVGRGGDGAGGGERLPIEAQLAGEVVVDGGACAGVVCPGRGDRSRLCPVRLGLPADVLEGVAEGSGVVGRGAVAGGGEAGSRVLAVAVALVIVFIVVGGNAPLGAGSSKGLELSFVFESVDMDR